MSYRLAIDYGAFETAAATAGAGRAPAPLSVAGRLAVPSVVTVSRGSVIAGQAADDASLAKPDAAIRTVRRSLGSTDPVARVPLEVWSEDAARATLVLVVREAMGQRGGEPPSEVVLTAPASGGVAAEAALEAALRGAGVPDEVPVRHVREDVATALRLAPNAPEGSTVVVVDLGVRLVASLLRRTPAGFDPVGEPVVRDDLGGDRADELLRGLVLGRLDPELAAAIRGALGPEDAVARASLDRSVRDLKLELAGGRGSIEVAVPRPGHPPVAVSRTATGAVLLPMLLEVADVVARLGADPAVLAAVCLAGGSSGLPGLDDLLAERFPRVVSEPAARKLATVLGAASDPITAPAAGSAASEAPGVAVPAPATPSPAGPAASVAAVADPVVPADTTRESRPAEAPRPDEPLASEAATAEPVADPVAAADRPWPVAVATTTITAASGSGNEVVVATTSVSETGLPPPADDRRGSAGAADSGQSSDIRLPPPRSRKHAAATPAEARSAIGPWWLPAALVIAGSAASLLSLMVPTYGASGTRIGALLFVLEQDIELGVPWENGALFLLAAAALATAGADLARRHGSRPGSVLVTASGLLCVLALAPAVYFIVFEQVEAQLGPGFVLAMGGGLVALAGVAIQTKVLDLPARWPSFLAVAGAAIGIAGTGLWEVTDDGVAQDLAFHPVWWVELAGCLFCLAIVVGAVVMAMREPRRAIGHVATLATSIGFAVVLVATFTWLATQLDYGPGPSYIALGLAAILGIAAALADRMISRPRPATPGGAGTLGSAPDA